MSFFFCNGAVLIFWQEKSDKVGFRRYELDVGKYVPRASCSAVCNPALSFSDCASLCSKISIRSLNSRLSLLYSSSLSELNRDCNNRDCSSSNISFSARRSSMITFSLAKVNQLHASRCTQHLVVPPVVFAFALDFLSADFQARHASVAHLSDHW